MKLIISADYARTIDSITKVVTALAIIGGGFWAVYQYLDGRSYQLTAARIESYKPLLEERLRLYVDILLLRQLSLQVKTKLKSPRRKMSFGNYFQVR
jgi:hypothetical protein